MAVSEQYNLSGNTLAFCVMQQSKSLSRQSTCFYLSMVALADIGKVHYLVQPMLSG